jgi:hypothetical protein
MNWEDKQIAKGIVRGIIPTLVALAILLALVIFAEDLVNLVNLVMYGNFEAPIFGAMEDAWWLTWAYR